MAFAPVCVIKKCPRKTCVRITDGHLRKDMCLLHGVITSSVYQSREEVQATDYWNGVTPEFFQTALETYNSVNDFYEWMAKNYGQ